MFNIAFFITNILLGVGLAMDAFSVSVANGLAEPDMKQSKIFLIAGTFAFYQFLMPEIGWLCVHYLAEKFTAFQKFIPWIALILLGYIGGKMLVEGIRGAGEIEHDAQAIRGTGAAESDANVIHGTGAAESDVSPAAGLSFGMLMVQGIATSIDALSVGFTIAEYNAAAAFAASVIIAIVTLFICLAGIRLGKLAGEKLADKATVFGGIILIGIGIEVFVSNIFF